MITNHVKKLKPKNPELGSPVEGVIEGVIEGVRLVVTDLDISKIESDKLLFALGFSIIIKIYINF